MNKVIEISGPGGADQLQLREVTASEPGPGEVRVRQSLIGVNFVDIYYRNGLYPLPAYPGVLGVEAEGVIDALGTESTGFALGDRVAYAGLPAGSYAEAVTLPAARLIKVPSALQGCPVAGAFLRGLTASLLLETLGPIRNGQRVLVHAAAGGLGLILTQWLKRLGAEVIGTVSSPEKAALARAHGLDQAILYKEEDFVAAVRKLTNGEGVDIAVEGIGGETLARTLEAVRPFGTVANIGQVGGSLPRIDIHTLTNRFLIRPSILAYLRDEAAYARTAAAWFAVLEGGLNAEVGRDYPFAEAARAQADMEAGLTTGAVRLVV